MLLVVLVSYITLKPYFIIRFQHGANYHALKNPFLLEGFKTFKYSFLSSCAVLWDFDRPKSCKEEHEEEENSTCK